MAGPLSLLSGAPVIIIRKEGADRPSVASMVNLSTHLSATSHSPRCQPAVTLHQKTVGAILRTIGGCCINWNFLVLPPRHHQHVSKFLLETFASPPPLPSSKEGAAFCSLVAPQHAALHSKKTLPALRADYARAQTAAVIVCKVRCNRKERKDCSPSPPPSSLPLWPLSDNSRANRFRRLGRQLRQLLTRSRLSHYSQSEVRDTPSTIPKASNVSRTKLCANRARALRIILPPRALGQALGRNELLMNDSAPKKPISAPGHWLSHASTASDPAQ
ncbi:hypothetical protein COCSADRAFT_192284 [Bipolaris sorokiniana ND90Pr]|uniref:Uncharacterized protein n=1 Tax=Cochliobolus sativus (strain ND90Pr / ATCC 201652) TaxID=665912 RepID=M2S265_COCSN|nr:uncharacterized protein COCSADRAFT_192284 [Bipolaris sorokiniana ND90Pr]EMD61308.1 hypothetical protein COCSADRAFT_192284 [Bipolaris sorokiniana ND90Pr]